MALALREIENNAHTAWESGNVRRAFSLFKKGAALGSLGCMLDLGYFYDEGVGTRQDKTKAMFWYKRAYRRGCSVAASNIAILYRERNQARQVFHWFRRAAALGDGDAQVDLAKLFLRGKGVRRSALMAKAALLAALASDLITEAAREEAADLLREIENGL